MARRSYDNSLRSEQAEQTRARILNAARDLLAESDSTSLSTAAIAARARVSEPTVYRCFGNREGLLEALAHRFSQELGEPPISDDPADLPAMMIAVASYFGKNASWMRSSLHNPILAEIRSRGRRRRSSSVRALLDPLVSHLEPRERELVAAMVLTLVRLESWDFATRQLELTDDEAGRATGWAVQALLRALEKSKKERRQRLLDDEVVERGRNWEPRTESRVVARRGSQTKMTRARRES